MMEVVSMVQEVLHNCAERAACYRIGQTVLRQLDRTLWVVEKCARWAVPPPLDQDERPQPELVRPLPWLFFLMMLVTLRLTRESISLLNLVMGKPPLRSADVVMYIQSKRRYLRTLKYHGNRVMRARSSAPRADWLSSLRSLLQLTMCFRRQPEHANNNTTSVSNNDQVLVVKRSKRGREDSSPVVSGEATMERLIEKMMVDLDAESDDDCSFTLTNVTSLKSDRSDLTEESDQDVKPQGNEGTQTAETPQEATPPQKNTENIQDQSQNQTQNETPEKEDLRKTEEQSNVPETKPQFNQTEVKETELKEDERNEVQEKRGEDDISEEFSVRPPAALSSIEETQKFIQMELTTKIPRTPSNERKMGNGRMVKSAPSKKKGAQRQERDRRSNDTRGGKTMSSTNNI